MPINRQRPAGFARITSLLTVVSLISACGGGGGDAAAPAPPTLSSDASLSSLSVTGATLDPAFGSAVTSYAASVPNSTTSLDITAATSDSNANFTTNGGSSAMVALSVGDNTITIVVTAENGSTTTTYTITVTRDAPALASIDLTANTIWMIANGMSSPTLSISFVDVDGNSVDESLLTYELQANNVPQASTQFTTMMSGEHRLRIVSGGIESNVVRVQAREQRAYPVLTLPVVFHVVHFGEPIGIGPNLLASEIDAGLEKLNEAFSNQMGSTDPNAVDTAIRFRLAALAPDGSMMVEPGINRFDGTAYDDGAPFAVPEFAGDEIYGPNEMWRMMQQNYWDPRDYISFFLAPGMDGRGSAALPRMLSSNALPGLDSWPSDYEPSTQDFGGLNLASNTNGNWILNGAHEIGHVLGLLHPWSYGVCGPGDYTYDTYNYLWDGVTDPPCPLFYGVAESTTIMDYRGARNTFTYDQRERLQTVLEFGIWIRNLSTSTK